MKKLFLLLGLVTAIAYPLEVSARDLVRVASNSRGTYYIWQDSLRRNGNIVWWTEEKVQYGTDGQPREHIIVENSGDCNNMASRVRKVHNQLTGISNLIPQELATYAPSSIGYTLLEYVCSQK
jgi:hypothetical protein